MKKSTMKTLVEYLKNVPEMSEAYDELTAELRKGEDKAAANRALYEVARDIVLSVIEDKPLTVGEIYEACVDNLPENFGKGKVQYALNHYWTDAVTRIDNDKGPYTYCRG